ncbi:MAG TPA: twin-arginine translocase subunit TatC [Vicinamibacterales bacterium]|jgi:sec-independent protein translocase protein TatC|nr:twin-arginine translocase subunit TatC [Vicinamibacterales bacterium]
MAHDKLDPSPTDANEPDGKMSFLDHLDELRTRLVWATASIGVGFAIMFPFIHTIFDFIMRPMQRLLPYGQTLIYTDPSEAFTLEIKIALIAGLLIASPLVFLQLWLFVAPGLYSHEKKWALPFILMSSSCFIVGAAFSHYVVFPIVWGFFVSFRTDYLTFMPRVEPAFSMYLRLLLALGVTFQLPTLVLFLARIGMVTPGFLIKNFKYAVLLIVIASAALSPDGGGIGMLAMGGPVIVLYMLSVGLAWAFGKKRPADVDDYPSQQALLFLLVADWCRHKTTRLLSMKTPVAHPH